MTDGLGIKGLSVRYGRAPALDAVDVEFEEGSVTAVVGPNGAGKSSLLLAAAGVVASSGRIMLSDQDISALSSRKRARLGIAIVPQGRQIFPRLSVRENLQITACVLGLGGGAVDEALDLFPVLRVKRSSLAGVMSGGEQQMLAVARALMGRPRVVLMDEMATGLAPLIVEELLTMATALARAGAVVVIAEPAVHRIEGRFDRGYVIQRGRIVGRASDPAQLGALYEQVMGLTA
jgi:branched-chain amino acid transport system ATP-binding protein